MILPYQRQTTAYTLHSNLVLFKYCQANLTGSPTSTLHSNLVLFKWYRGVNANFVEFTLHSNLVLFKYNRSNACGCSCNILYIPIWFYSNNPDLFQCSGICTFTFQSGSIQIFQTLPHLYPIFTFTFQSGSIQMTSSKLSKQFLITLHSNLVLFKSETPRN